MAFILYLTDEWGWETKDGGALQLLSRDVDGQPLDVVREILPENNQLVFFPVANNSYHQVGLPGFIVIVAVKSQFTRLPK